MKKKIFLIFVFILISNFVSSQENDSIQIPEADALIFSNEVPLVFNGIWQGDDRIIMFQEKTELENILDTKIPLEEKNYIWCYLKTFYGWYLDRAAEKNNRKNTKYEYDKNNVVFRDIQNISIEFMPLINGDNCSAYEIRFTFPRSKQKTIIPVAVIDDKLYLDFAIKNSFDDISEQSLEGSWSRVAKVSGIKISEPITKDEFVSLVITNDSIYQIRYWKTDMEFSNLKASFSDGNTKYEVPKHILSCGNVYTCVTGRSLVIRNVKKSSLDKNSFIVNERKNIIAFGNPYLIKTSQNCSLESMMKIVDVNNSRRAPNPNPPFEPSNLDWHIDDINRLELNNQIIQAVRKRQREFYQKYGLGLKF